ncbi:hypothetical protein FKM82_022141 [Ascaphus truei]
MLLRPEKEFVVDGSHMIIRTLNPFRNYIMDFTVGEEFKEDLSAIDGRVCKTTVSWEDNKLVCVQRGQVPNRGWKQWLEGDLLHVISPGRSLRKDLWGPKCRPFFVVCRVIPLNSCLPFNGECCGFLLLHYIFPGLVSDPCPSACTPY